MNDTSRYNSRIKKIGKRIKAEREAQKDMNGRKMSQEALAEEISNLLPDEKSVGQNSVSNWEQGAAFPPLEKLICMAHIFHCDVAYLLCDYDERNKDDAAISDATGLSTPAIKRLKKMQVTVKRDKAAGWNSTLEGQELAAINALLEHDYSTLLYIYQYLYGDYDTYWVTTTDEQGEDVDICMDKIRIGYKDNPNGEIYSFANDSRETFMLKIQRGLVDLYNYIHPTNREPGHKRKKMRKDD